MCYVITLYFFFYITHRNYNDVMYTLWFPPTYGPLARRTTRVWAVFQTGTCTTIENIGTGFLCVYNLCHYIMPAAITSLHINYKMLP